MKFPTRDQFPTSAWRIGLFLACMGLLYFSLALYQSHYHAVWSPDSGTRMAMIRSWIENGSLCYLPYDAASVDPRAVFHPLGDYALALPRGIATTYSPFFPWLAGLGYRLGGELGLTYPALLGGLGTLFCTYLTAGRLGLSSRKLLLPALALATPLVLYSVVFWDHSVHMALVAGAGYCLLRGLDGRRTGWLVGAGALLGLGLWFQELFGMLLVALILAAPLRLGRQEGGRAALSLIAGFLPLAGAWAAVNTALYGVPGGPHSLGPNQILHPYLFRKILDPSALAERTQLELVGSSAGPILAGGFAALILIYVLTARGTLRAHPARAALLGSTALLGYYLMHQADWSHGLLETTPLLIPALAPPDRVPPTQTPQNVVVSRWCEWLYSTTLLFGILVVLNPLIPGMDWGSRYLLTLLPVLTLLSARNLERVWAKTLDGGKRRWAIALGLLLVASTLSQFRGWNAIEADLAFGQHTAQLARNLPTGTLVSDIWWLGPELTLSPSGKRHLLFRETADPEQFMQLLRGLDLREFCYLGTPEGLTRLTEKATRSGDPFRRVRSWNEGSWSAAEFAR